MLENVVRTRHLKVVIVLEVEKYHKLIVNTIFLMSAQSDKNLNIKY